MFPLGGASAVTCSQQSPVKTDRLCWADTDGCAAVLKCLLLLLKKTQETVNILSFNLSFKLSPGLYGLQSTKTVCHQKCLQTFTACFRKPSEKFPRNRDQHCLWEVGVSVGNAFILIFIYFSCIRPT